MEACRIGERLLREASVLPKALEVRGELLTRGHRWMLGTLSQYRQSQNLMHRGYSRRCSDRGSGGGSMRRAMALAVLGVSAVSGCSLTEAAGLSSDVRQVEQEREDFQAKLTDDYPHARVRSVRCIEEHESRLQCTARLSGADRERT